MVARVVGGANRVIASSLNRIGSVHNEERLVRLDGTQQGRSEIVDANDDSAPTEFRIEGCFGRNQSFFNFGLVTKDEPTEVAKDVVRASGCRP